MIEDARTSEGRRHFAAREPSRTRPVTLLPSQPLLALLLLPLLLPLGACGKKPKDDPHYRAPENILEVVAVLQHHVPDDTYHFPPARDYTGRNVYRASLLRLENLERAHENALRAGHMDGVITFAKARALERLRAYSVAAEFYRAAAERESSLREEALRGAVVCDRLDGASSLLLYERREVTESEVEAQVPAPAAVIARYDEKIAALEAIAADTAETHYTAIALEEIERSDLERARYFRAGRRLFVDGDERAIAETQRLVSRHSESKNANRHVLELADLYATLAEEYADTFPPEGLRFDAVRFHQLVSGATRLYERVAHQDGTAERLEAGRKLEAFLAFTLRIDIDRFTK